MKRSLILASQSPRRKELLTQLGYKFICIPANINEKLVNQEQATEYVKRLAQEKAFAVAASLDNLERSSSVVLGSDTSVVYKSAILGKPEGKNDCIKQLQLLSGKTHQVLTSIAVVKGDKCITEVIKTDVTFKDLSLKEIINYWNTGEPKDKAGSYGIQGIGGQFVTHISGSYSAVVGLPLFETSQLLAEFGLYTSVNNFKDEQ